MISAAPPLSWMACKSSFLCNAGAYPWLKWINKTNKTKLGSFSCFIAYCLPAFSFNTIPVLLQNAIFTILKSLIFPYHLEIHFGVFEQNSFFTQSIIHIWRAQIQKDFFLASQLWIWRLVKVRPQSRYTRRIFENHIIYKGKFCLQPLPRAAKTDRVQL